MMAVILSISDIDGTLTARKLEEVAYMYGLMDMRQVFLVAQPFMPYVLKVPAVDRTRHYDSVRTLTSLAIINYALSVHLSFDIMSLVPGRVYELKRINPSRAHKEMTDWCINLIRDCVKNDPL